MKQPPLAKRGWIVIDLAHQEFDHRTNITSQEVGEWMIENGLFDMDAAVQKAIRSQAQALIARLKDDDGNRLFYALGASGIPEHQQRRV